MGFDRIIRNALSVTVSRAREHLKSEVMDQLRLLGFQSDGSVLPLDQIAGLSETDQTAGRELRTLLEHFVVLEGSSRNANRRTAYDRLVREIGFTILNRLVALRMAEERGLIVQAVGRGFASDGFQIYERVARDALGNRTETYRAYLECLYDELSIDLPVLFDRTTPEALVFPSERCLHEVLALLNNPSLEQIWKEDEAIGWVYQYYNDPIERKKMREASPQAPRNSRELAVRNQFFTPRYVVEFLTDNTLGRIWYEMCHGQTDLVEQCQYLIIRSHPIWLHSDEQELELFPNVDDQNQEQKRTEMAGMWIRPNPAINNWKGIAYYAATLDGYIYAKEQIANNQFEEQQYSTNDIMSITHKKSEEFNNTGKWHGTFKELRICLFFKLQQWSQTAGDPEGDSWIAIQLLYQAICEVWDHEVDIIPHRAKKDPRDLKILDPACGSGHFLLYAFDILEVIYQEAWYDDDSPVSEVTGTYLQEDYTDINALRRAMPELIIRHNLYGVDIDLRASQIAALALWLRAQRSYDQINLQTSSRPSITKSNIVCAEPMPGERDMLEEFLKEIDLRLRPLVRIIWEKMRFAGEAGILLEIEIEIENALKKAREAALVDTNPLQASLFPQGIQPVQQRMTFTTNEERTFWKEAKENLFAALRGYATHAVNGYATQRRLFAEDATRGFAFIDLCRNRFDVVLMNPPFGGASSGFRKNLEARGEEGRDLAAAFISSTLDMVVPAGFVGALTTRTIYFLKGLSGWRRSLVDNVQGIDLFLDLGFGVLDAAVETAAAIIRQSPRRHLGHFIDALGKHEEIDREGPHFLQQLSYYLTDSNQFEKLPRYPFAYWASTEMVQSFTKYPSVGDRFQVKSGGNPRDDFRFIRHWVEVDLSGEKVEFVPYSKGGEFRTYHYDVHLMLQWKDNGRELKIHTADYRRSHGWSPDWRAYMNSYDDYFKPGITWPRRTSRLGFRILPAGCVFGDKSPIILSDDQDCSSLFSSLALLNTRSFASVLKLMVSSSQLAQSFEVGIVRACPLPELPLPSVELQVYECFTAMRILDSFDETSHEYIGCTGGLPLSDSLTAIWKSVFKFQTQQVQAVLNLQSQFDALTVGLFGEGTNSSQLSTTDFSLSNLREFAMSFISQAVGCIFGRWDFRILINPALNVKRAAPFTRLPYCSPAMLLSPSGRSAKSSSIVSEEWLVSRPDSATLPHEGAVQFPTIPDSEHLVHIPWDGILVNDPGHPSDIISRIQEMLTILWPSNDSVKAEYIEQELCQILDVNDLREYFHRPSAFFDDHLKKYTKSRRQAPLYWPLSTASNLYTLWIYYPRLTSDTLFTAVNQYVEPKIAESHLKLTEQEMRFKSLVGRDAVRQREVIERSQVLLKELQDFRSELLRIAALPYRPDFNDGIIINAAPLYSLFRLPKWSKETRECWENLQRGEYDWSHVAYSIWPERVREKCRTDQSLAIAHDLEQLYVAPLPAQLKKRKSSVLIEDELELIEDDQEND